MDPSTDDKEQDSNVSRMLLSSQWNRINQVTDSRTAAEPYGQLHKGESPGGDGSLLQSQGVLQGDGEWASRSRGT